MAIILVVEDELVLLGLIASSLRQDGHTTIEASDPLEALDILKKRNDVDLLLTDVEMKPISGIECVKRIAVSGVRVPALFMSGYPSISGKISSTLGASAVIEKPFTAAELRRSVNSTLANSKLHSASSEKHQEAATPGKYPTAGFEAHQPSGGIGRR